MLQIYFQGMMVLAMAVNKQKQKPLTVKFLMSLEYATFGYKDYSTAELLIIFKDLIHSTLHSIYQNLRRKAHEHV